MLPDSPGLVAVGVLCFGTVPDIGCRRLSIDTGRVAQTDVLACVRFGGLCSRGVHFFNLNY